MNQSAVGSSQKIQKMRMIKRIINKKSAYALNNFSFYATAEISTTIRGIGKDGDIEKENISGTTNEG